MREAMTDGLVSATMRRSCATGVLVGGGTDTAPRRINAQSSVGVSNPWKPGRGTRSPEDGRASVQVVSRDATSPVDSVLSVHVGGDVEEAYAEAQRRGYEIVHPLTLEPWGVRRFFVRDPDGNVINTVSHSDD